MEPSYFMACISRGGYECCNEQERSCVEQNVGVR